MSRAKIVLTNEERRVEAAKWVSNAPPGTTVEFTAPGNKRSLEQNSRMWAMFTDISQQLIHFDGKKYNKEEWCDIFWDGFRKELTMVPDLYGIGVVSLRRHTSTLRTDEMTAFMEFIASEAILRGVEFRDDPIDHIEPKPTKPKPAKVEPPKLTRAEVMAKARAAKAAKAAEKPAGKRLRLVGPPSAKPAEITVEFAQPEHKVPATTDDYVAYAQAQILANRGKVSPAIMETWFLSQHEVRLRQDCKVGQLATQLLHSLIK